MSENDTTPTHRMADRREATARRRLVVAATCALFLAFATHVPGPASAQDEVPPETPAKDTQNAVNCEMQFVLTKGGLVIGLGRGCGVVACTEKEPMNVSIAHSTIGGSVELKRIKGVARFSKVDNPEKILGSYEGTTAGAGLFKDGETSSWEKDDDVLLELKGSGSGLGVNFARGKLELAPLSSEETCEL